MPCDRKCCLRQSSVARVMPAYSFVAAMLLNFPGALQTNSSGDKAEPAIESQTPPILPNQRSYRSLETVVPGVA
jgi:hypothetical protein